MPRSDDELDKIDRHSPQTQLWLVAEVAEYLRCSKDQVYRLVACQALPHSRLFGRKGLRFHPDEIEKWARFDRGLDALKNVDG